MNGNLDIENEDTMRFGGAYGRSEGKKAVQARHEISRQAEVWEVALRIERGERKWSMEALIPSKLNTVHQKYVDLPLFF